MWVAIAVGSAALVTIAFVVLGAVLTGGSPERPVPDWLLARPFAHRGLHDRPSRPENSLSAFEAAARRGVGVELDVHLSRDGVPIVMHDDDLMRMTGYAAKVSDLTVDRINSLSLLDSGQRVPTLAQALRVIDGRVPLLIEIKNEGDVGELEDAVADTIKGYEGNVAIMSFNPYSVARVAVKAPEVPRGQLSGRFKGEDLALYKKVMLRCLFMNWKSRSDFVAYEIGSVPSVTTFMQRLRGRPLIVWTSESPADTVRAVRLADNVIANPLGLPPKRGMK
ncbi:MAG TPA: glycerophosphodiester phosphodiesterase family protein [Coriobacteriia bacterium]|nr:glycerophosphodiester phosphodiesterase family protein [Coriobacteriia bacterium]